jgi:Argonaute linker 2 domain
MKTPDIRKKDIEFKVRALNWPTDPTLKRFGMSIAPQMATVPSRRLANPVLAGGRDMEGGSTFEPNSGKWDLRGYRLNSVSPLRFIKSNCNSLQL